jgi:hypothetical protein
MFRFEVFGTFEVGDGTGDLEDSNNSLRGISAC